MTNSINNWLHSHNLVLILIAVYFLISIIKIEHPGVNNDQLMFVNSATLNPDNIFLWKSFHGLPVMIFPYLGALKSYLYMPIFYLFGVNIWSIRLPQIILIAISLFLLYKTITISLNKWIALLTILFLSIDPSLIAYSRTDQGPSVIEFCLKILVLYFFILYYKGKNKIFFLSIFPLLALGIFNKINFFWFVNAFLLSLLIFFGRNLYLDFKKWGTFTPILLLIFSYFLLLRLFLKLSREVSLSYKYFTNEVSFFNIFNNFPIFYKNLTEALNGNLFFNTAYGYNPTSFGNYFVLILIILFFSSLLIIIKYETVSKTLLKFFFFYLFIFVFLSLQILLTRRAISAWHSLAVYPFVIVIFISGVFQLYKLFKSFKLRLILIFFISLLTLYQLLVNLQYLIKYSSPTKAVALSSTIYDLIDYAKISQNKFICLDVDICNQLLSLTQQTNKYFEPFGYLDSDTYNNSFVNLSKNFNKSEQFLYIAHGDKTSHFPDLKFRFFRFLNESRTSYQKIKEFKDGENIIFEAYKIGKENR